MKREKDICWGCDHFCTNNDDGILGGCRAFPGDIDSHIIGDLYSHDKPIEGNNRYPRQDNDYVYMPAKSKTNRWGNKIQIYQESNPYADENGRYNGK